MKKAINEVWKCIASQQINNALNTYNALFIAFVYDLPINLLVLVYQKKITGQTKK